MGIERLLSEHANFRFGSGAVPKPTDIACLLTVCSGGGGLIYDTGLNVTWLADANYAKTSGYDADGAMN